MEGIVLNYLPLYSGLLEITNKVMTDGIKSLLGLAGIRTLDYDNMTVTGGVSSAEEFLKKFREFLSPFGDKKGEDKDATRPDGGGGYGYGGVEGMSASAGDIYSGNHVNKINLGYAESQLAKRQKEENITYGSGYDPALDDNSMAINSFSKDVVTAINELKTQAEAGTGKNSELLAQILNGVTESAVTQDKIYKAVG